MPSAPLVRKLHIKPGKTLVVLGAPPGFLQALGPLPDGVRRRTSLRGQADVIVAFVRGRSEALAGAAQWKDSLAGGGVPWVCYPKLTSTSAGELSREVLWRDRAPKGLRPVAMVAIDATRSAMRFKVIA